MGHALINAKATKGTATAGCLQRRQDLSREGDNLAFFNEARAEEEREEERDTQGFDSPHATV